MKHALAMVNPWCISSAPRIFASLDEVATRLDTVNELRLPVDASRILGYTQRNESQREAIIRDLMGCNLAVAVYRISDCVQFTAKKKELCQQFSHNIPSNPQYIRTALDASGSAYEFSLGWLALGSFFDPRILR